MASLLDHIDYLSKEIGARPAGTEEEQQAALYIAEQFQKEASFPATIEEFTSSSNLEGATAILAVISFVATVLAMLFGVLTIPMFILAALAAAVYVLEAFDKPVLSRMLARGASQNVIAKYQPFAQQHSGSRKGRSRKVVLVAHYDTAKVTPQIVRSVQSSGLPVGLVSVGGMAAAALLLLIRVFAGSPEGFGGILLFILTIVVLACLLLPIVKAVLVHLAPYNEGANNNASGVAAIIEVARRISRGSVSEADLAASDNGVTIHGEAAAIESGLVPEGAQIRYEAEKLKPPEEIGAYDEEERLLSAKAAIAALTGKPVERKVYGSVADRLVNSRAHALPEEPAPEPEPEPEPTASEEQEPAGTAAAPQPEPLEAGLPAEPAVDPAQAAEPAVPGRSPEEPVPQPDIASGFENAPSWFIAAQQNAKRTSADADVSRIQRSRYTEAIEGAEREAAERERAREEMERQKAESDRRARQEAARAAIAAAGIADRSTGSAENDSRGEQAAAARFDVPDIETAPAPSSEDVAMASDPLDPASTVAQAPISADEIRREMESQDAGDGFIAPPEEFSMPSRRFELPKIESKPSVAENTNPSRSGLFRRLRNDVPSLSGVIRMQEAGEDVSQKPEPVVDLPAVEDPAAKADLAAPLDIDVVLDSPVDAVDYDMEVSLPDDFSDVVLDSPVIGEADAAAPARVEAAGSAEAADAEPYDAESDVAPRPRGGERAARKSRPSARTTSRRGRTARESDVADVEMPSSRAGGFLGRLRGKGGGDLEETPQEWLEVDEDFDARTVGRKRGGWESFREDRRDDQYDDQYDDDFDQYDDFDDDEGDGRRGWNGGSFSRVRLGHVDMRSGEDSDADEQEPLAEPAEEDIAIAEEIEQIYHFRNPLFNTEIWFVAIGSDTDLHDGARAFLAEHRDELRGSMIIEVESLGVGDLAVASEEGRYRKLKASSRVKRYMRQATAATGIAPGSVALAGSDSITTVLQKAGCQTMHLLGVEEGQPSLKGSADDVLENIDELTLEENVNFLLELVKRG